MTRTQPCERVKYEQNEQTSRIFSYFNCLFNGKSSRYKLIWRCISSNEMNNNNLPNSLHVSRVRPRPPWKLIISGNRTNLLWAMSFWIGGVMKEHSAVSACQLRWTFKWTIDDNSMKNYRAVFVLNKVDGGWRRESSPKLLNNSNFLVFNQ